MNNRFENPPANPQGTSPETIKIEIGKELPKDPEVLRNNIERIAGVANKFFQIEDERKAGRYEPYFDLSPKERPYIREFVPSALPENVEPQLEDLEKAENKFLALSLEVGAQIVEYRPRGGAVREDTDSLKRLFQTLGLAENMRQRLAQERPADADKTIRELLIKSRRKVEGKEISDGEVREFAMAIQKARGRLGKNIQMLERYSGR